MIKIKTFVAQMLCPAIVVTPQIKKIQDLRYALEGMQNGYVSVHKRGDKHVCVYDKKIREYYRPDATFEEHPTIEYYKRLFNAPRDMTQQIAQIEVALKRILRMVQKGTKREVNPRRRIVTLREYTCKCGNTYIDHCPCGNKSIIHNGAAYREMRERTEDLNGISMAHDSLYSEAFARQSEPRSKWNEDTQICPKLAQSIAKLNRNEHDVQKLEARDIIESICAKLRFGNDVINKAHYLFCQYRTMASKIKYFELSVAACIFYALPVPGKPTVTVRMTRRAAIKYGHNPIHPHTLQQDLHKHGFHGPIQQALKQYYDSYVTIEVPRDKFRAKKPDGTWSVPGAPQKRSAPDTITIQRKRMRRIDLKKEQTFTITVNGKQKNVDHKTYRRHLKYGVPK